MLVILGLFFLSIPEMRTIHGKPGRKTRRLPGVFLAFLRLLGAFAFSAGFALMLMGEPFALALNATNVSGGVIILAALFWLWHVKATESKRVRSGRKISPFSEFNALLLFVLGLGLLVGSMDTLINIPIMGVALYVVLFAEHSRNIADVLSKKMHKKKTAASPPQPTVIFFFSKNPEFTAASEISLLVINAMLFFAAGAFSLLYNSTLRHVRLLSVVTHPSLFWTWSFVVLVVTFALSILAKSIVYHRDYFHLLELGLHRKRSWTISWETLIMSMVYALFILLYIMLSSMLFMLFFSGLAGMILGTFFLFLGIIPFVLSEGVYFLSLIRIFDGQGISDSIIGAVRDLANRNGIGFCRNLNRERLIALLPTFITMPVGLFLIMNTPWLEVQWFAIIGSVLIYVLAITHLDVRTYEDLIEFKLRKLRATSSATTAAA